MIGVVIVSYGSEEWKHLGQRAYASVREQTVTTPVKKMHWTGRPEDTLLHNMRNGSAQLLLREHPQLTRIVFLDADDELEPGYIAAMEEHHQRNLTDMKTIVSPTCRNVNDGPSEMPFGDYPDWRPVGCVVPVSLFQAMGGFEPWPILEDLAFWLRAEKKFGAKFEACKQAVYIIHNDAPVRRNPPNGTKRSNDVASAIRTFHGSYEDFVEGMGGNL